MALGGNYTSGNQSGLFHFEVDAKYYKQVDIYRGFRAYGERVPLRAGHWITGTYAGVFNWHLFFPRSITHEGVGFRASELW